MRKIKLPKIFSSLVFCFLFLFFSTSVATANNVLFEDDFSDANKTFNQWKIQNGFWNQWGTLESNWTVEDGTFKTAILHPFKASVVLAGDPDWDNYQVTGNAFGEDGVDQSILFRFKDKSNFYGLDIRAKWDDPGIETLGNIILFKWVNGIQTLLTPHVYYDIQNGVWYSFKIVIQDNNIHVEVQDKNKTKGLLSFDYLDGDLLKGKIGLQAWSGQYLQVYPSRTVTKRFDNIRVTLNFPPLQPLILLPGLGGSWNHEEIFLGIDQPQSAWYKTPFTTTYDGLIQSLQNAGYTLGENLFVFYYDWLQSIDQSATDLKNYIDTIVNPPPGTKVDLIGHSLGGLVGRAYIQNNPGSHKANQLITAGSPHKGAPQVYKAWEGADLHKLLSDKHRIGVGILLRLRGFSYQNLVQAIQNLVPSLGNLLFINDYLKWNETGIVKPESTMSQQNTWLKDLGVSSELLSLANTLVGTNIDTTRWLNIVERSYIDEILGRWQDGKPVGEEFTSGDKTVLEESAMLAGANNITLSGLNHGDLVKNSTGQRKILELLGFSDVEIVEQIEIPFEPALVFAIASPATLRVTDPQGRQIGAGVDPSEIPNATFWAQEKIIIIPQALDGKYGIEVVSENEGGTYQLLIGQLTDKQDLWTSYQGEVEPDHPETYTLPFDSSLETTDIYLAKLINLKLRNLLRQTRGQDINFRVKARQIYKVFRILGQTRPLPMFLRLKRDKLTIRYTQRAISRTANAIDYAERFDPDKLPPLREILDLLGELHQLLES